MTTYGDHLRRRRAAATGMDLDVAELLVGAAVWAPSVHNTQPWRFVHDRGGGIELWADRSRWLSVTDPAGRQLVISCGAALAVLMVGVRWLGFEPSVTYRPVPADPALLARLAIGPPCRPSQALDMFVVAAERHTHRGPFDDIPIAPSLLDQLRRVAARGHCRIHFVRDVKPLLIVTRLTATAEAEQRRRPAVRAELGHWLRPAEGVHRDGIPAAAAEVPHPGLGRLAPRRYGPATGIADQPLPGTGPLPTTIMLSTSHDDVTAWLHAGVALQRMLLLAARHSVYASIHTQPLEIPETRRRLAALVGGPYPQMLLQLGHADSAPSAAPRRPPSEVLTAA